MTDREPVTDQLLTDIADYVCDHPAEGDLARQTARLCLMDSLGCAVLALNYPACVKLLGPVVREAQMPDGVPVPGTNHRLDPVTAAFNIGCMIRWLDFNDTWLAQEWGHPSDNLGAVLACADYVSRRSHPLVVDDVITAMIKAYEIQGVLALGTAFNRVGLDHVLLVRVASTAVATAVLGGSREQVVNALANAWLDGGALRTYRHAPNTGSRKGWAAGDATSRAVRLALMSLTGEMGYPTALSAATWGFCDALNRGNPIELERPLGTYVMENVLFKIRFPAEFHAQTAVEAAVTLHPQVRDRMDRINAVRIRTQEPALRIIDKTGPLNNPADRDHCLQYMVAVALIRGDLTADDYEDDAAADPRIDAMRANMVVTEDVAYSRDYLAPDKRSIANAVQVCFDDGSCTESIEVQYPIGHRRRRDEALPLLHEKFESNLASSLPKQRRRLIIDLFADAERLLSTPVEDFMDMVVCTQRII